MDFWISLGFLDFIWISGFRWISDWISSNSVRDFESVGPLDYTCTCTHYLFTRQLPPRSITSVTLLPISGICTAITSTGDGLQQYEKLVGSSDGTTTKPVSTDVLQLGRASLLPQLNKQRFALNDTHIVQATATGLLVLDAITGNVEQSLPIEPSSCTPLELAEANGLNAGSSDKPIVLHSQALQSVSAPNTGPYHIRSVHSVS